MTSPAGRCAGGTVGHWLPGHTMTSAARAGQVDRQRRGSRRGARPMVKVISAGNGRPRFSPGSAPQLGRLAGGSGSAGLLLQRDQHQPDQAAGAVLDRGRPDRRAARSASRSWPRRPPCRRLVQPGAVRPPVRRPRPRRAWPTRRPSARRPPRPSRYGPALRSRRAAPPRRRSDPRPAQTRSTSPPATAAEIAVGRHRRLAQRPRRVAAMPAASASR